MGLLHSFRYSYRMETVFPGLLVVVNGKFEMHLRLLLSRLLEFITCNLNLMLITLLVLWIHHLHIVRFLKNLIRQSLISADEASDDFGGNPPWKGRQDFIEWNESVDCH